MSRLRSDAGIAIGPILFMLAILGLIATVMATNSGGFSVAGVQDRISADIVSQANMIRSKINECQLQYLTNGVDNSAAPCLHDAYPCSDQTALPGGGTNVSALTCPGDPLDGDGDQQNIWTGLRVAQLPPQTKGFSDWKYMNAGDAGGRCIWTAPSSGNTSSGVVAGLTQSAAKFTSEEVSYLPASNTQKFVVFITAPTGSVNEHCAVP